MEMKQVDPREVFARLNGTIRMTSRVRLETTVHERRQRPISSRRESCSARSAVHDRRALRVPRRFPSSLEFDDYSTTTLSGTVARTAPS